MPEIDNYVEKVYLLYNGPAVQKNTTILENDFTIFMKIIPISGIFSKDTWENAQKSVHCHIICSCEIK